MKLSCGTVYYSAQGGSPFESVDEILKCDHSNESYWAVLSCGTVCYSVQGGSIFWVCGWNPKVWPFKWKFLSNTFLWYCILCYARWFYLLSLWTKSWGATIQIGATKLYFSVLLNVIMWCTKPRGGSRGRVQGVRNPPPHPPGMTCGFLIQLVFCPKKLCGLLVLK